MSSGPQHKMYDYEVAPPHGVWEKIAAELDESELSQRFPSLLYHSETAPPVQVWQKIASALDEPVLINDYSAKLAGIEVAPPATAWNKIQTSLSEATTAPVRRINPWIKYAAAAVFIGFMAWGGLRFLGNGKKGNEIANDNTTQPAQDPNTANTSSISFQDNGIAVADMNASLEEARNDAALEASKKTYAKLDVGARKNKVQNAAGFYFVPTQTRGIEFDEIEEPLDNISSRYIVLMTPDGNIVRMSKKLRDLVCCVSGEAVDQDCVDQMKKWREKIASPSTHSPGNFLDILSLVSSLQEN